MREKYVFRSKFGTNCFYWELSDSCTHVSLQKPLKLTFARNVNINLKTKREIINLGSFTHDFLRLPLYLSDTIVRMQLNLR